MRCGKLEKQNKKEATYLETRKLANEMTFSIGNASGTFLKNFTTNAFTLPRAYPRFKNSCVGVCLTKNSKLDLGQGADRIRGQVFVCE